MEKADTVVAVFADRNSVEAAVKKLTAAGFEIRNLSVVGKRLVPKRFSVRSSLYASMCMPARTRQKPVEQLVSATS